MKNEPISAIVLRTANDEVFEIQAEDIAHIQVKGLRNNGMVCGGGNAPILPTHTADSLLLELSASTDRPYTPSIEVISQLDPTSLVIGLPDTLFNRLCVEPLVTDIRFRYEDGTESETFWFSFDAEPPLSKYDYARTDSGSLVLCIAQDACCGAAQALKAYRGAEGSRRAPDEL